PCRTSCSNGSRSPEPSLPTAAEPSRVRPEGGAARTRTAARPYRPNGGPVGRRVAGAAAHQRRDLTSGTAARRLGLRREPADHTRVLPAPLPRGVPALQPL